MPVKKRVAKTRQHRITPDAIAAFRAGDRAALHRALELRPWEPSPLETDTATPPAWLLRDEERARWAKIRALMVALEKGSTG